MVDGIHLPLTARPRTGIQCEDARRKEARKATRMEFRAFGRVIRRRRVPEKENWTERQRGLRAAETKGICKALGTVSSRSPSQSLRKGKEAAPAECSIRDGALRPGLTNPGERN